MNRATEMELIRLLHGELPPDRARELRARLEREPELAAAWTRLQRTWNALELPPPAPAPPGFAQRLAARAREQAGAASSPSWATAPGWVRATAAAALVTGIALGAGAGLWTGDRGAAVQTPGEQVSGAAEMSDSLFDDSLAESYWSVLDELGEDEAPAGGGLGGEAP
jgi:anti-sigma factor RsiW